MFSYYNFLLDKGDHGYLTFDQFFLIFALITARESGRLTQCLYEFAIGIYFSLILLQTNEWKENF